MSAPPDYIATVLIVALILWLFGHLCRRHGERQGFARGCRFERDLAAERAEHDRRTNGHWLGYN